MAANGTGCRACLEREDKMKLFEKKERDIYDYDYDREQDYIDSEMAALDDDVTIAEEKLNRSIKRKEHARDMAVKDRLKSETDAFRVENKRLKKVMKKMFRKAGRPAYCASALYYAVYAPAGIGNYLAIAIAAAIEFFGIPFALIKLLNVETVAKVFIYIGVCAFFVLVYILIRKRTRPKEMREVINRGRPILKRIKKNKKEIKKISRAVKRDKDDSKYNLEEFDNEITRNKGLYDVAMARKHTFMSRNSGGNPPDGYDREAFEREPESVDGRPEAEFKLFVPEENDATQQ